MTQEGINNAVVDTSFINSLMDKHDVNHSKAKEFFKKNKYNFHAPEFLIIELCSFFERKYGENSSDAFVEKAKEFISFHHNYSKIDLLIQTIKKFRTRGADSLFVRLADKMDCVLITCDIDQAKKYPKSVLI